MDNLDDKNCTILEMLQKNCRTSLTDLAKAVDLSVDSVKKRLERMIQKNVFYPKIQLRPRNFGFQHVVEIKVKLHNCDQNEFRDFVNSLMENPYVVELMQISGQWDFTLVIIAKDGLDLGRISSNIRKDFHKIIQDWMESLTKVVYKFESYDLHSLKLKYNEGSDYFA